MTSTAFSRISIGMAAATLFFGLSATLQAKEFVKESVRSSEVIRLR